jgi:hypothetical protein
VAIADLCWWGWYSHAFNFLVTFRTRSSNLHDLQLKSFTNWITWGT